MTRLATMVLLSLALGSSTLAAQQPTVLTGRVVNGSTREPVGSAQVSIGDDRRTTREDGRFLAGPIQPGTLVLEVRAIGYLAHSRSVVIQPGQRINLVIELAPVTHQVDSITVVAQPDPSISGEELAQRGGDLATALNGWQGIVVSRTGHGNEAIPQIRGSAADEVLVLVDGFALNDPFTGRADLSRIPVQDIETIALLRGAQSARAGSRAVAGVIQISTRQVLQPEFMIGIGSAESRRARVAAGAGTGSVALSLEALPNDFPIDLPTGGEGRRSNAGGEIWSLNGSAAFGLEWTVRGTMSDRGLPGTTVNPTPVARGRDRSLVIGARTGNRSWFRSSLQWLDTRAEDPSPPPGFIQYDSHTWGWGTTVELGVRRSLRMRRWSGEYSLEVDGRHDRFDGDAVQNNATFSRAGSTLAASLSRIVNGSSWTIAPAVRIDWFTGRSTPLGSARVDLSWSRGTTSLNASLGNGVTVPALADLLFRDGVGVAINSELRPERVEWEAEAGVGQAFTAAGIAGTVRVSGFYGRIGDMILWTPNFRNIWSPGNFAVRRGGAETNLEARMGDFFLSSSAAFSRITYATPDRSQVPYRPRFSSSVQGSWSPGPWRLSLGWNHLGTRFSRNREMNPLPPFDLFHVSVARQLGHFSLEGEVRDLTDARPTYIAGFPTPGRAFHLSLTLELP